MEQRTDSWFQARCGRATASNFADIMAKGEGKMRAKYLLRVASERLTGIPLETFSNRHTDRGTEQEPFAKIAYMAETGRIIEDVGFIQHPELMAGCSPDGFIEADGGGEFKCVIPTVQIETIRKGGYPNEHKPQIQGGLWITGRQWWDFASYSPDFKDEKLRLYIFRVERDEDYIAALEKEVRKFLDDVESLVNELQKRAA